MIGLAKFMKGSTTIGELENMPNTCIHAVYKMYIEFTKNMDAQKASAAEDMMETMEDGGI